MNDLDRIEHLLATKPITPERFERCAQDLLGVVYPGLSPIRGGSDWGRDADLRIIDSSTPARLLATASRTLEGVRKNMRRGITSMKEHGVPTEGIVLANLAKLSLLARNKLVESARNLGARLEVSDIFDIAFFSSKLRRDSYWRKELLALSSEPISLSHFAPELAESPWRGLPLVGRDQELARLAQTTGDIVVTGSPGAGKSRLLQELPGVAFVDVDAGFEHISDDLRWLTPEIIVVDDAAQSDKLVRHMLWLRRTESDIFRFRIVAVCWPDQVEEVSSWLPGSLVNSIELLPRRAVDQVLLSMGITGELARAEILDQAEGRPGWAIALGDILLRAHDGSSLLSGAALYGEVTRYLHRAGVKPEIIDVLAAVAALGGFKRDDVEDIGAVLGLPTASIATLLTCTARSGLIDIKTSGSQVDAALCRYTVRPPMLANVLVAERVFGASVPALRVKSLLKRWPDRMCELADAAIGAARIGAVGAREAARDLFKGVLGQENIETQIRLKLAEHYAFLDLESGEEVVALLRSQFDAIRQRNPEPWTLEPLLGVASLISQWHLIPDAVEMLLDAALLDKRPTNSYPGHPLRQLEDIVHAFHPEMPPPYKHRDLVINVLDRWMNSDPSDEKWHVFGFELENVLSLHLHSMHSSPGNPQALQLMDAIVNPAEIDRIYTELWPKIKKKLTLSGTSSALRNAILAAEDWLRIGAGHDQPFGRSHPQDAIDAARRCGGQLLIELSHMVSGSPGLVACLRDTAETFDIRVDTSIDQRCAAFFENIDMRKDWQKAIEDLQTSIYDLAVPLAHKSPTETISFLKMIRDQLELSSIKWPDRIAIACQAISNAITMPIIWVDAALEAELFPEAAPFIRRICELKEHIGEERLKRLLGHDRSRWCLIEAVLLNGTEADREVVIRALEIRDYHVIRAILMRPEVEQNVLSQLLTDSTPAARGAIAAAMFTQPGKGSIEWSPPQPDKWCQAIERLDMSAIPGLHDYESRELTEYLAKHFPESLSKIVENSFTRFDESTHYTRILPLGSLEALHHLPHEVKDLLWSKFQPKGSAHWLLLRYIVGQDVEWLSKALQAGRIGADEALSSYSGFGPHPSIEQLSRLLVPRGVDPARIASLAINGIWSGSESGYFASLVKQFEKYCSSDSDSIVAVGRAGVEIYKDLQRRAENEERRKLIRGEL